MSKPLFTPFRGWLVQPQWAGRVIAGAYDSKTPAERRTIIEQNPYNYFGVTRSPADLAPDDAPTEKDLLRMGAETLTRLLDVEAFAPVGHPAYFAYRLSSNGHAQTGVVGALDVDGLHDGRVRTHENVRAPRAELLGRHLAVVGASSSPVALTHPPDERLRSVVRAATDRSPALAAIVEDVEHRVWTLTEQECAEVTALLADARVYVTDGHHRCAAAVAARDAHPHVDAFARTLAVLFPADELRVEAFHRRSPDRDHRAARDLRAALATVGAVTAVPDRAAALPTERGTVGVYHHGAWSRLTFDPVERPSALASLDVERLRRDVIGHILGVDELAPDNGVDYVPGPSGVDEVVARCDADGLVGLVVHPTDIHDLMAVADAGELMPPKSSYFAPKPRSGVFLRVLGRGATAHLDPS